MIFLGVIKPKQSLENANYEEKWIYTNRTDYCDSFVNNNDSP
jgi:hypothetical protein